jgi:hypothetical protein
MTQKKKKLDLYTSKKSISRNGYVIKGKMELLTNFKFILIPTVEILEKEIQSLCKFSCLKTVKLSPQTRFKVFFSERDAFSAHKTYLSLH